MVLAAHDRHPILIRLLALQCLLFAVTQAGEAVATVSISADAAWGGPWQPAAGDSRTLPAGGRGTIAIPAWWGEGLRPPSGTSWRIELEYQDASDTPLTVELFAGLPGWREVHRIGGLGDKEWRMARIPAPWDMVMRQPGTGATAIALRAAGTEVPVRAVRVVPGDPAADEARWQAETRAWVARTQASALAKATLPETEDGPLDPALAGRRLVPFVRTWHRPINLNAKPKAGETGTPLRLRVALNETEPAQFGLHAPGADVLGCTVDLGELRRQDGRVLPATCELLAAEYAVLGDGTVRPQRLWPAYGVDVRQGGSHMFLLRVTTAAQAADAGVYRGAIAIRGEAVEARLPVEVEILPIALRTMSEAGLHVAMCSSSLQPQHELAFMAKANLDGISHFSYTLPIELRKTSRTDFDIDFTVLDDFMLNAKAAGIRNVVYFLGGDPYGYPDTLSLVRELYRRVAYEGADMMQGRLELLRKMCADGGRLPPEVLELLKVWTGKFLDHGKAAGWPEVWLSPFDEPAKWVQKGWGSAEFYLYKDKQSGNETVARVMTREREKWLKEKAAAGIQPEHLGTCGAGPWLKQAFLDQCAAIHEARPEARIYASIHHAEPGAPFRDAVDIYCSDAIHEDRETGTFVAASKDPKKWFWLYDFSRDAGDPANMRYIFGFFHAAFGATGSLCYAWNWDGKFDSSSGATSSLFAYTSPYGVITQPHFEGMREALDDRRYLATLQHLAAAKGRSADIAGFLAALADKSGRRRPGGKWDNVDMLYRETGDANALDTLRGEAIDQILRLK
jgi:hypothetical protein